MYFVFFNLQMTIWESPFNTFHRLKEVDDDFDPKKGKRIMILRGDEPPEVCKQLGSLIFHSFLLLVCYQKIDQFSFKHLIIL